MLWEVGISLVLPDVELRMGVRLLPVWDMLWGIGGSLVLLGVEPGVVGVDLLRIDAGGARASCCVIRLTVGFSTGR